jgi:hypothetical protein
MEEVDKKVKSKKNKQKDVILIDNVQGSISTPSSNQNTVKIKPDINMEEEAKKEEELKKQLKEARRKQLIESKHSNKLIKDLIFQIQLMLSYNKKIDPKLVEFLMKFLSEGNLKEILEERDSEGFCGNISCEIPNSNNGKDRYEYDYKHKKFLKNELNSLFCNVKCLQKYKDLNKICEKFDYMLMTKEKTYYELTLLRDYFPNNSQINAVSEIAGKFLELNRISLSPEKIQKIRTGLNKLFVDDIEKFLNFEEVNQIVDRNISKMIEENMKIDN